MPNDTGFQPPAIQAPGGDEGVIAHPVTGRAVGPAIGMDEHTVRTVRSEVVGTNAPVVDEIGELSRWHAESIAVRSRSRAPIQGDSVLTRSGGRLRLSLDDLSLDDLGRETTMTVRIACRGSRERTAQGGR